MRVVFTKLARGNSHWTAWPPKRRPVSAGGGVSGNSIPHDLVQFLVEREEGHRYGFWGCVADGGSFRSLARSGRKRTPQGRKVIDDHTSDLDTAEAAANAHWWAWRRGEATTMAPTFDAAAEQWFALPEGGSLELEFPLEQQRPRRR